MSDGNDLREVKVELQAWIDEHLSRMMSDSADDWGMPVVVDWFLVMGIDDANGEGSATCELHSTGPRWRRIGLLTHALDDLREIARDE